MAEATDSPHSTGEVPSGERVSAWPASAAGAGRELNSLPATEPEPYRPLSLLALAAFGAAVVYSLVVLLGGVVALLGNIPWLMPAWTFLIPIFILVLCWAARRRIRNREGTLSGLPFTVWGLRLTVVVGLTYAAYYGFTFFAVRLQAIDCANQFFEQLEQGRVERAFLIAMGVTVKDMDDAELRDLLEVRFNSSAGPPGSSSMYNKFRQAQFVRAIETSGRGTHVTPLGVVDWGYEKGGYHVTLRYHVVTSMAEFEMNVDTFGRDSKPDEPKGRQWLVAIQKGETLILPATLKFTRRGEDFTMLAKMAQSFVSAWQEKVNRQRWDEVYLDTLKPAERDRMRKGLQSAHLSTVAPVAGLALLSVYTSASQDFQNGRKKLPDGKLIQLDEKTFWTSKRERPAILQRIRHTFQPAPDGRAEFGLRLQQTQMPLSRSADGEVTILFDADLVYMEEGGGRSKYIIDGRVAVVADEKDGDRSPSVWRVQGIEISSGRTPPTMPEGTPPGRPPGMDPR